MEACQGMMGETKNRTSKTNVGKVTHVETCADVYGGLNPFLRRCRSEEEESGMVFIFAVVLGGLYNFGGMFSFFGNFFERMILLQT